METCRHAEQRVSLGALIEVHNLGTGQEAPGLPAACSIPFRSDGFRLNNFLAFSLRKIIVVLDFQLFPLIILVLAGEQLGLLYMLLHVLSFS